MEVLTGRRSLTLAAFLATASIAASEGFADTLPQGLTCGVSYVDSGLTFDAGNGVTMSYSYSVEVNGVCNGTATITTSSGLSRCYSADVTCSACLCTSACVVTNGSSQCDVASSSVTPHAATGYAAVYDGDFGNHSQAGFYHQELTAGVTGPQLSTSFVLPAGAVCGFHHTQNSPGHTCMGYAPAKYFNITEDSPGAGSGPAGCPAGWTAKSAFDMSSTTGYWVWCEYDDPMHFSHGPATIGAVGIACGMAHNGAGTTGQCMGNATIGTSTPSCPAGATASSWLDAGRPSNVGLGFCSTASSSLPACTPGTSCAAMQVDRLMTIINSVLQ